MDWGGKAGPFKRVNVRSYPSAPARWEWGDRCRHSVKRVGRTVQLTAVRETSRSDGRWRRWDSGLQTLGNSSFGYSILIWARKKSTVGVSVDRRPCESLLGMDLTGRWIVTMGIVTMLVSELQLLIGNQLVLGPGCSTAISWCWGPAAARQSIGVRARLQHGNQLVLGPSCSTAISWCWSPAAARQSTGVGARMQHGNQLVLGPGCSTAISWCWGRGRPWFTMPTTMLLLMTAFM